MKVFEWMKTPGGADAKVAEGDRGKPHAFIGLPNAGTLGTLSQLLAAAGGDCFDLAFRHQTARLLPLPASLQHNLRAVIPVTSFCDGQC
jgi:hypothetical protein